MNIIDMEQCEYSSRHARYLGNAGDKDGILYKDENWIVKYPKSTNGMVGNNLPAYTSSPLSEYIGSKIYEVLGIPVHEVELCIRNDQIAVACKDFQKEWGDLLEIRGIKNAANRQIHSGMEEGKIPVSATGDNVNLEELFLHFEKNPMLMDEKIQKRFWECVIVDILIDNNDRNNGNWGLLYNHESKSYDLAPVFDNGNAFMNKTSDERLKQLLEEKEVLENSIVGTRTIYSYHDKILSSKKILSMDNEFLKEAVLEIVPKIEEKMKDILGIIDSIPEKYEGHVVCCSERKEVYKASLELRLEKLLEPVYDKVHQNQKQDERYNTALREYGHQLVSNGIIDSYRIEKNALLGVTNIALAKQPVLIEIDAEAGSVEFLDTELNTTELSEPLREKLLEQLTKLIKITDERIAKREAVPRYVKLYKDDIPGEEHDDPGLDDR